MKISALLVTKLLNSCIVIGVFAGCGDQTISAPSGTMESASAEREAPGTGSSQTSMNQTAGKPLAAQNATQSNAERAESVGQRHSTGDDHDASPRKSQDRGQTALTAGSGQGNQDQDDSLVLGQDGTKDSLAECTESDYSDSQLDDKQSETCTSK